MKLQKTRRHQEEGDEGFMHSRRASLIAPVTYYVLIMAAVASGAAIRS